MKNTTATDPILRGILQELALLLAPLFAETLQGQRQGGEWIDQFRSPLCLPGQKHSRRHCSIVKRRIQQGLPGAFISPDGKQFFLTTAALCEECRGAASVPAAVARAAPAGVDEAYEGVMRIVHGGRRG